MIPPAAELKLLKAEQSMLLEETKIAAEHLGGAGVVAPANNAAREAITALATRQRELTELAERLKLELERRQNETQQGQVNPDVRPVAPDADAPGSPDIPGTTEPDNAEPTP